MKIYVISNTGNSYSSLAEYLERQDINIVIKEGTFDNREILRLAEEAITKNNANLVIVFADDYQGTSMMLNKSKYLSAALCKTERDVKLARNNDANAIVIGDAMDNAEKFGKALMSEKEERAREVQERPVQEVKKPAKSFSMPNIIKKNNDDRVQKQEKEDERVTVIKRNDFGKKKGVMDKLKDSLGIID